MTARTPKKYKLRPRRCLNSEVNQQEILHPDNDTRSITIKWLTRFCVDFRRLNALTVDTSQELPHIQDTLKDLGNANIFSTIDLRNGYWQVPMESGSKKYTTFTHPQGSTYQFRVIPFGLKNTSSTFQRLVSQIVLVGYMYKPLLHGLPG